MKYIYSKWIIGLILLQAGIISSCKDLDRDNNLDPKNPGAAANQVAVVENFVHRYTNLDSIYPSIRYSQEALQELTADYKDRLIILEYHMFPGGIPANDTFATTNNENRYTNEYKGSAPRAFPHTFFNGKQISTQGASSKEIAKQRYETILDTLTVKTSRLYCQAAKHINGSTMTVETQLVKYGDEAVNELLVEFFLIEDIGDSLHYTVRQYGAPEPIYQLMPSEVTELPDKTFNLLPYYNADHLKVIVLIKDNNTSKILQACKTE